MLCFIARMAHAEESSPFCHELPIGTVTNCHLQNQPDFSDVKMWITLNRDGETVKGWPSQGHHWVHGEVHSASAGTSGWGQFLGRVGLGIQQQQWDQCQWAPLTNVWPCSGPSLFICSLKPLTFRGSSRNKSVVQVAKVDPGNSHLGIASGRGFQYPLSLSSHPRRVFFILKKYLFIYLAVLGLSCSLLTFSCGMWGLVPWPRIELRLPWTREVPLSFFFFLFK